MTSFARYYAGFLLRPRRTADALVRDPRRLRLGAQALLITAVLYTLVYVFLVLGGGRPFKPWLTIPAEAYYRWNVVFLALSMFLCWILASGLVQLLARSVAGSGSFEDTASVLGFGIAIPSWSTLLHDLVSSFLGAIHVIDQRAYEAALNGLTFWRALLWVLMTLYLVWFLVAFAKAVGASQRVGPGPAALLGTLAFVSYQLVFLVFNR